MRFNVVDLSIERDVLDTYLDGSTHINCDVFGATKLGRMLSLKAKVPFEHPVFGRFNSLEGYYYFIKYENLEKEKLQTLWGRELHEYVFGKPGERSDCRPRTKVLDFLRLMYEGTYYKIKSNPEMIKLIRENQLQYDVYYKKRSGDDYVVVRPGNANWFLDHISVLATWISEAQDLPATQMDLGPSQNFLKQISGS